MEGYPEIGTLYLLRHPYIDRWIFYAVVENNFNKNSTILEVVEKCPELGMRTIASSSWINSMTPVGITYDPNGKVVVEDGVEYIKPLDELSRTKNRS